MTPMRSCFLRSMRASGTHCWSPWGAAGRQPSPPTSRCCGKLGGLRSSTLLRAIQRSGPKPSNQWCGARSRVEINSLKLRGPESSSSTRPSETSTCSSTSTAICCGTVHRAALGGAPSKTAPARYERPASLQKTLQNRAVSESRLFNLSLTHWRRAATASLGRGPESPFHQITIQPPCPTQPDTAVGESACFETVTVPTVATPSCPASRKTISMSSIQASSHRSEPRTRVPNELPPQTR